MKRIDIDLTAVDPAGGFVVCTYADVELVQLTDGVLRIHLSDGRGVRSWPIDRVWNWTETN